MLWRKIQQRNGKVQNGGQGVVAFNRVVRGGIAEKLALGKDLRE